MGERWFEALRPVCKKTCLDAGSAQPTDVVLFYLARWCQKKAKADEPDLGAFTSAALREVAERIVANLAEHGERVERLAACDAEALADLERLLLASARPRAGEAAPEYAEEALQKIATVLWTGTPPSRAIERLRQGPAGPSNEYVFQSPFPHWARSVVIRLVIDERRRLERERRPPPVHPPRKAPPPLDRAFLKEAHDALPGLLDAIRRLPPAQRGALVVSLRSPDIDVLVRERLHELAPDLFSGAGELFSSDEERAEHLGTTPGRLRASRSLGRRKLAERDPCWEALLDALLPHGSTRPIRTREATTAAAGKEPDA